MITFKLLISLQALRKQYLLPCLVIVIWLSANTIASAAANLVGTCSIDGQTVALYFNAAMDPVSAGNPSSYTIPGATIQGAILLADNQTILLSVTGLSGTNYQVTTFGLDDAQTNSVNITGAGVILGMSVQDIGNLISPSIVYAYQPHSLEVQVNGGNIWFNADAASLISQPMTGDFDVKVQVTKTSGGDNNSNMALDVRESADPSSRHVAITVYPGQKNWTAFFRDTTGGGSGVLSGNWRIGWPAGVDFPNVWLRIKYAEGTFTTYGGTNGLDWIQVGDPYTPSVPYSSTIVGPASAVTDAGQTPLNVEYANFGNFSLTNASISITSQPTNTSVIEYHPVTFSVGATLQNGSQSELSYQWQSNNVDILGATGSNYILSLPTLANNQDQFRVRVTASGLAPVYSSVATLTVQADTQAPYVISSAGLANDNIGVYFDKILDPATASDVTHYALGDGTPIQSATLLPDQQTVVLQVSGLSGASYTLHVTGVQDLAGNSATNTITGIVLNYSVQDIGNLISPSLVYAYQPSAVEVQVNGGNIWFNADAASLISQPMTGDFDVKVQVTKTSGGDNNSNMALDVRESADPSSRHVAITVYPGQKNWTAFFRDTTGGGSGVLSGNWRIGWPAGVDFPNTWLRIKYAGGTFTTYGGTNGLDWIQVGDPYTPSVPYSSTIVGLASAVTDAGQTPLNVEYANFGNFSLTNASISITSQPTNTSVAENHSVTFSVAATLLNGPQTALSYQWQSNGVAISGAISSNYTFVLPKLTDSGTQFRVAVSAPGLTPVLSAIATLTVQTDTQPPVALTTAGLTNYDIGVYFNELLDPVTASDLAHYTVVGGIAIQSATLLPDSQTVVLQTSGLTNSSYSLQIDGVKDLAGNPATQTISGQVMNYVVQDIGSLDSPSLVYAVSTNTLQTEVNGGVIWSTSDSANLIYEPVAGDFDLRVQVTNTSGGDFNSNMALDVRESADPTSRHVAITVYPGQKNWTSFFRDTTGGASSVLNGNWRIGWPAGVDFPNAWLRIKRVGNTFTTYGGTNGVDWTQVGDPYTPSVPYASTIAGVATAVTDGGQPLLNAVYSNFGATLSISQPQLQITTDSVNVTLRWLSGAVSFQLQQSTQIGAGAVWNSVTNMPVLSGGFEQVVLPLSSSTSFYRLIH